MRNTLLTRSCLLLCIVLGMPGEPADGREVVRWKDRQGRTHFGDHAPAGAVDPQPLRLPSPGVNTGSGLRPAEVKAYEDARRRAREATDDRRKRRETAQALVAKQRRDCTEKREQYRRAQRTADFSEYALYLRRHCW